MVIFEKDGLAGIADESGQILLSPCYSYLYRDNGVFYSSSDYFTTLDKIYKTSAQILPFTDGLAPFKFAGKWGYMNYQSKIVIDTKFDEVTAFYKGVAAVKAGDKWGFINKKGEFICKPTFDDMSLISTKAFSYYLWTENGIACVQKNNVYFYVDFKGENLFDSHFEYAEFFSNGLALVTVNGEYRSIHVKGDFVSYTNFQYLQPFEKEVAACFRFDDLFGAIDINGNIIIEPIYEDDFEFCNGFAKITDCNGKNRWFDVKGNEIILEDICNIERFYEGIATVESSITHKMGVIETSTFTFIVEPIYDEIQQFENGAACVTLNGVYGIISKETDFIFNPLYGETSTVDKLIDNCTLAFKIKI